jgi:predicted RNA-binding Zn ribbon-like protein
MYENDDCRWVFYDESKSQSLRWCASVCSNLIRVRRFRERHRAS